jgi:hypothetical protein
MRIVGGSKINSTSKQNNKITVKRLRRQFLAVDERYEISIEIFLIPTTSLLKKDQGWMI